MMIYEKVSRYFLGVWFLAGAIEGWAFLLFDVQYLDPSKVSPFLGSLMATTYFWAFLKLVQSVGAISLLVNYKPALGLALVTPVSVVLFLFYLFEFPLFLPLGFLIAASTIVLFRTYRESFSGLLRDYPRYLS